jgi:hypothetical protein
MPGQEDLLRLLDQRVRGDAGGMPSTVGFNEAQLALNAPMIEQFPNGVTARSVGGPGNGEPPFLPPPRSGSSSDMDPIKARLDEMNRGYAERTARSMYTPRDGAGNPLIGKRQEWMLPVPDSMKNWRGPNGEVPTGLDPRYLEVSDLIRMGLSREEAEAIKKKWPTPPPEDEGMEIFVPAPRPRQSKPR